MSRIIQVARDPGKSHAAQVIAGSKVASVTMRSILMLRFEILEDSREISCIIEGADDYYCGHGQTPEQAMVDLFGKLGAI